MTIVFHDDQTMTTTLVSGPFPLPLSETHREWVTEFLACADECGYAAMYTETDGEGKVTAIKTEPTRNLDYWTRIGDVVPGVVAAMTEQRA